MHILYTTHVYLRYCFCLTAKRNRIKFSCFRAWRWKVLLQHGERRRSGRIRHRRRLGADAVGPGHIPGYRTVPQTGPPSQPAQQNQQYAAVPDARRWDTVKYRNWGLIPNLSWFHWLTGNISCFSFAVLHTLRDIPFLPIVYMCNASNIGELPAQYLWLTLFSVN